MDKIDEAVAAAAKSGEVVDPEPEARHTLNLTIKSTGRVVVMNFPIDLDDGEIAEWMGFLGTDLLGAVRDQRSKDAPPVIEVARSMPSSLSRRT